MLAMVGRTTSIVDGLARLIGREHVSLPVPHALRDALTHPRLEPRADAHARPGSAEDLARVVSWCASRGIPMTPRGGGTGLSGGAVPTAGGVVIDLVELSQVHKVDPAERLVRTEAGAKTATVQRRARESGLWFPPDPGAADQSQIGGNIATNAAGPHALRYGSTGDFVLGLDAVLASGEPVAIGGPARRDVAGYDVKRLMVGSEGTLAIFTAAWLRLLPHPDAQLPVLALFEDEAAGCDALEAIGTAALQPSVLEFFDAGTLAAAAGSLPEAAADKPRFAILAETDGDRERALDERETLLATLAPYTRAALFAPVERRPIADLWRWRDGVSGAVAGQLGGKISEDVVVPITRLRDAMSAVVRIGGEHGLRGCSWGHAGDGIVHATYLLEVPAPPGRLEQIEAATRELAEWVLAAGGSISGEHGIGWLKTGLLEQQLSSPLRALHHGIKQTFDPANLLNPGKALPSR
jgi:FAD/FMN-containing dehydrogenase